MRYALMAVLAMGVVGGYGSAFARMAHHARGGCHGGASWNGGGWHDARWREAGRFEEPVVKAAPAPAPVVVQAPAAPAPQIVVIMPGATPAAAPQTVVVPAVAPAPSAAP
ncbi:MAG: hypothetical protein MUC96_01320 [Myxococcaceae bacterium]|jgi:hypothetical protein|nr:hypothetical protein [Myxococcaceae bacterium]